MAEKGYKEFQKKLSAKQFDSLLQIRDLLIAGEKRKHIIKMIDRTIDKGYDIGNIYYSGENDLYKD